MWRTHAYTASPLYDMLYTNREGGLWYINEEGNLTHSQSSRRGVRQGCVLGLFVFFVTMSPIYKTLREELGQDGMLVAFSYAVYLHGP